MKTWSVKYGQEYREIYNLDFLYPAIKELVSHWGSISIEENKNVKPLDYIKRNRFNLTIGDLDLIIAQEKLNISEAKEVWLGE